MSKNIPWKIAVDTGGTFTDCIAQSPDGEWKTCKVLSSGTLRGVIESKVSNKSWKIKESWKTVDDLPVGFNVRVLGTEEVVAKVTHFDANNSILSIDAKNIEKLKPDTEFELDANLEAPVLAAHLITDTPAKDQLPKIHMRLATTRATNALLERKGHPPILFITKGFGDLLHIGNQTRPYLFSLDIKKPEPYPELVVEVEERLDASGNVVLELNEARLRESLKNIPNKKRKTAAVVFLHSYLNSDHENRTAEILKSEGFEYVSVSSELSPMIRVLERAQTTVVNAYLEPIINAYLDCVFEQIGERSLESFTIMTSAGGLRSRSEYFAKDSLLSGPAGGIVGATFSGKAGDSPRCISFDMGGTSTDVARIEGVYPYVSEHTVGDAHLLSPAFEIHTVAAGGGSICRVEQGHLLVGPESAGSWPGPACYGAGGPLSITDVNLLLGRLLPELFEIPINLDRAREAAENELAKMTDKSVGLYELLEGFIALANLKMANAIRQISVQKGYNPKEYGMISFGGAGSQHACGVAEQLGITKVLIPANASLLSAEGLIQSRLERIITRQILRPLSDFDKERPQVLNEMQTDAFDALKHEGVTENRIEISTRMIDVRLSGQDSFITLNFDETTDLELEFRKEFNRIYGYDAPNRKLEIVQIRIVSAEKVSKENAYQQKELPNVSSIFPDRKNVYSQDGEATVPVWKLDDIKHESKSGPCLVAGHKTVIWVEQDWAAAINESLQLVLTKAITGGES